jgi:cation:H+ antiporter
LADTMGLSKLFVGMVVVAFGTSAPELLVTLEAATSGSPDIAIGNIIGSNIANMLLILGVTALVAPLPVAGQSIRREALIMIGATILLMVLLYFGRIPRPVGIAMVVVLIAYVTISYLLESRKVHAPYLDTADAQPDTKSALAGSVSLVLGGLAGLAIGAYLLVEGASGIARSFGVSEATIGLTVVALGTSLPELAASVVAALRRHPEVVIANVIGSNTFNILGNLGATAIVAPMPAAGRFIAFDGPVMCMSVLIVFATMVFVGRIGRLGGAGLLTGYALYLLLTPR